MSEEICDECKEWADIFTQKRPDFGKRQVRDLSKIKVGREYTIHFTSGGEEYQYQFICISEPFQDKDGTYWIRTWRPDIGRETKESLADSGVVPYAGFEIDCWNNYNWLEKTYEYDNAYFHDPTKSLFE